MTVTVDTEALAKNALALREALGDFYCVLKCNAYGHGDKECARTLYGAGMRRYAVFSLSEALRIRPHVGKSDILILGKSPLGDLWAVAENGFIQTVSSEEYAALIAGSVPSVLKKLRLHLEIDTGMNRSGIPAYGEPAHSPIQIASSASAPRASALSADSTLSESAHPSEPYALSADSTLSESAHPSEPYALSVASTLSESAHPSEPYALSAASTLSESAHPSEPYALSAASTLSESAHPSEPYAPSGFFSLSGGSVLRRLCEGIEGAFTHFPSADARDLTDTENRLSLFLKTAEELETRLGKKLLLHSAASAAALRLPRARLDLCRIGLLLYGVSPIGALPYGRISPADEILQIGYASDTVVSDYTDRLLSLTPVMSLFGRVSEVRRVKRGEKVGYGGVFLCQRDSVVATVDGGYANGIPRALAGSFMPIILGRRVPLIAVCMDRCMLDVTRIFDDGQSVRTGETVTFFGKELPVRKAAEAAKTISYEILTAVGNASHALGEIAFDRGK